MTALEPTPAELSERERWAIEEQALDEAAVLKLRIFVRRLWHVLEPGMTPEWPPHMDIVCDELQAQIEGHVSHRKLLFVLPPGTAKSLLVSVYAPAFEWLWNPERRRLVISGNKSVVERDSIAMRTLITHPDYQRLLAIVSKMRDRPPWYMAKDQNRVTKFQNSVRGFRQSKTLSAKAKITGERAHDITVDDPTDLKEYLLATPDRRKAMLEEVGTVWKKILPSRVMNQSEARWTVVMQRVDEGDLADLVMQEGGFRVVQFAMEYDPHDPHNHPRDWRTVEGELLYGEQSKLFGAAAVKTLSDKMGLLEFDTQYNGKTSRRNGGQIRREWFADASGCRWRGDAKELGRSCDEVAISSDAAKKATRTSDMHSIQVWGRRGSKRYLLARVCKRMTYPEYEQAMKAMIAEWQGIASFVLIEDTANGTTFMQSWGGKLRISLLPFSPTRDTPGGDKSKAARAIYLERAAQASDVVVPDAMVCPWVEEVLDCWCAFPAGRHDDDLDSASQLLMRWTRPPPSMDEWTSMLESI